MRLRNIHRFALGTALLAFSAGCMGTLQNPYVGSYQGSDPVGDTGGDDDPRGDIGPWAVYYSPNSLRFALKTQQPTDILTDPNWLSQEVLSIATWGVETTNDGNLDFIIGGFVATDRTPRVVVESEAGVTCTGQLSGVANGPIEITIDPVACFGGAGPIRVQASLDYETPFSYSWDAAPNDAWGPWIVPSAS